jgi:hypothetical protein
MTCFSLVAHAGRRDVHVFFPQLTDLQACAPTLYPDLSIVARVVNNISGTEVLQNLKISGTKVLQNHKLVDCLRML